MAHVDYYLKVDGAPGESQATGHADEIEVVSWDWSEAQGGSFASGTGGGAGRVKMEDFTFTMRVCKASPKLLEKCASGEHIGQAIMTARKAGKTPQDFLKYTFKDLLISSFKTGGSGSDDVLPLDEVKFNFAKIKMEYAPQKNDGSLGGFIEAGWDLQKNQKQ